MKLKKIWINSFKNIHNLELDFSIRNGTTVLIGNNGSGKSNILEAISSIFYLLLYGDVKDFPGQFEITYEINTSEINISNHPDITYKIKDTGKTRYKNITNKILIDNDFLPSQVIALYSGEELRLWNNFYKKSYLEYSKGIRYNQIPIEKNQKMIYINKYYWDIALLTMFASSIQVNDIISIGELKSIKLYFNQKTISKFSKTNQNRVTDIMNLLSKGENESISSLDEFINLVDFETHERLFNILAASYLPENPDDKLITKIELIFENDLSTNDLSEGEKKKILLRLAISILSDSNSLLLLDEPDSYLHIANKYQIKDMLHEYDELETILTTHSPTLTHIFDEQHIIMINNGRNEDKTKQEIFAHVSNGIWNYQEQSIFLASKKEMILLVEGKHDKAHINEAFKRLKYHYNHLEFDIFFADGANNLKQLVLGFSTTDFDFGNKKIIAIFDDDEDGRKGRNQQNFDKVTDDIYVLKSNSNFFGILLPKRDGFSGECTIENMYEPTKFKEAMNYALINRLEHDTFFNTGINDISRKIKEDAKNRLMYECLNYEDQDFKHFENLFNLIENIRIR